MRLCLLGKYPPVQGGVSSQMYWLARALAELGHEVHVVTNSNEVEPSYRIYVSPADCPRLECRLPEGGSVTLHKTNEPYHASHIPYANPFVSKLAALAADVTTKHGCDIIFTSYFEPYGFAGALASRWTNVPFTVKHAGSDIGHLAQMPERTRAYRELLREADLVLTGAPLVRALVNAGVDLNRIHLGLATYWPGEFSPRGPVLDIAALLDEVHITKFASPLGESRPYDPTLPTIGMYGKPGQVKGTPDLIEAARVLHQRGKKFNLVFLCGVAGDGPGRLADDVQRCGLEHLTYMLPYLPHWRVPEFLRACTAVCVLENHFPIAIHQPATALEVLACGTCLVLSEEIRAKQWKCEEYRDQENFLLVRDPQDISALASTLSRVIDYPADARRIGAKGSFLFVDSFVRENPKSYEPLVVRLAEVIEIKKSAMSLQALQNVITKLYTNPAFRAAVQENESLLDDHCLTAEERAAAAGLVAMKREVDSFADGLYEKTFRFCWNQFTTIKNYFQAAEPEAFRLHRERYDFVDRGWFGNIEQFATTLLACTKQARIVLPACFADAVRYDLALIRSATVPLSPDQLAKLNSIVVDTDMLTWDEAIRHFTIAPAVHLARFDYDIPALYTGTLPTKLLHRQRTFGFVPSMSAPTGVVLSISPTMERMLDRARLVATLADLVAAAGDTNDVPLETPGFSEACLRGIKNLFERGLIVPAPLSTEIPEL